MIKKLSLLVFIVLSLVVITNPVLALEESDFPTPTKSNRLNQINAQLRDKLKIKEASRQAKIVKMEANMLKRFKKFVEQRINQADKIINREGILLDKLQIRIDAARVAGKDVTELNRLMVDARAKLADAKSRLEAIKTQSAKAEDKTSFKNFGSEFGAIYKDLKDVKVDASQIIRQLKGFNSTTSESSRSGKIKTGSASAKVKVNVTTNNGTTIINNSVEAASNSR